MTDTLQYYADDMNGIDTVRHTPLMAEIAHLENFGEKMQEMKSDPSP